MKRKWAKEREREREGIKRKIYQAKKKLYVCNETRAICYVSPWNDTMAQRNVKQKITHTIHSTCIQKVQKRN